MLHHQDFIQLGQNLVGHILRLILFSYHLILFSLSCSLVELSATSSGPYSARTELILHLILFSYHLILFFLSSSLVDSLVEPMYVLHHQGFIQLRTEFCWTYITPDPLLIPPHLVLLILFTSGAYVLHHQCFIQLGQNFLRT